VLSLLPLGPLWIDVEAFEARAVEASRSGDETLFEEAVAIYGDDLLPEDRYEDWVTDRRLETWVVSPDESALEIALGALDRPLDRPLTVDLTAVSSVRLDVTRMGLDVDEEIRVMPPSPRPVSDCGPLVSQLCHSSAHAPARPPDA
jgi:hypothetical protein